MTKKYHRRRHLKGGDSSFGETFSNLGNSISQGASSMWNKTKKIVGLDNTPSSTSSYTPSSTSSYTPSSTSSYTPSSTSSYTPSSSSTTSTAPITSTYSYGGKKLRKGKGTRKIKRSRTMKRGGNFSANTPINSLASRAGDFTGGLTARVKDLVGGKRRRKTRRSRRSRR
jgi:hypothetical protein